MEKEEKKKQEKNSNKSWQKPVKSVAKSGQTSLTGQCYLSSESFNSLGNLGGRRAAVSQLAVITWKKKKSSAYWCKRISVCHRRESARAVQRCLLTNCLARSGGNLADQSDLVNPQLYSVFTYWYVYVLILSSLLPLFLLLFLFLASFPSSPCPRFSTQSSPFPHLLFFIS